MAGRGCSGRLSIKKEEKIQGIHKRAYEYAKTGKYGDVGDIELKLRSEGFTLAERVLDDRFIREEINSLCKVATSPQEVERRNRFDIWLNEIVGGVSLAIREEAHEVSLFVHDNTLFVNGPTYSFEIRRNFGNNELEVTRVWEEEDGQRYRYLTPDRIPDSNFEEITDSHAVALVMKFVRSGKAKARRR